MNVKLDNIRDLVSRVSDSEILSNDEGEKMEKRLISVGVRSTLMKGDQIDATYFKQYGIHEKTNSNKKYKYTYYVLVLFDAESESKRYLTLKGKLESIFFIWKTRTGREMYT